MPNTTNYDTLLKNISQNQTPIKVSTSKSTTSETTTFKTLIETAKNNNQTIIFTFTPGPFKKDSDIPLNWRKTLAAIGCTAQLTAFDEKISQLDAKVYAVNQRPAADQRGTDGILAIKNLHNISMISINDTNLIEELGLLTIPIDDQPYLKRLTLAITPEGEMMTLDFPETSIDKTKADEHLESIKNSLNDLKPQENLTARMRNTIS